MEQVLLTLKYIGLGIYLLFILRFLFLSFKDLSDIYLFEYEHLPDQWERDGKPRGIMFWKFPEPWWRDRYKLATFRSASISPMFWIFVTPEWANNHPDVLKFFGNLRKNVVGWNIGILFFFFLVFLALHR